MDNIRNLLGVSKVNVSVYEDKKLGTFFQRGHKGSCI